MIFFQIGVPNHVLVWNLIKHINTKSTLSFILNGKTLPFESRSISVLLVNIAVEVLAQVKNDSREI